MKKEIRLIYKLFPSYLLITLVSLLMVSWTSLSFTRQFYLDRTRAELETDGRLLEKQVARLLFPLDERAVDRLCKDAGGDTPTRVTVVLPDGRVVGDSEETPAHMANHSNRSEIRDAYQGNIGVSVRHSDTLSQKMMYVALPLYADQTLTGVLRTSLAVTAIDERIGAIRWRIAAGALLVALLASGVSWFVSRRITQPLERMRSGARQFAAGDLSHRLPPSGIREFSDLAETIHGHSVLETIRNHEFRELMDRSLSTGETLTSDIGFHQGGERIYNVHCTPLLDNGQKRMGGLVVVSDVTQLRRLENMRRDFAASVSHEIKTPLTAIKGFVETLLTGDLDDRDQIQRFLTIIDRHVNRLATIIDDLMQLSRIEGDRDLQQIGPECCDVEAVLSTAITLCSDGIEDKRIDVKLSCEGDLTGCFDGSLLEQAAVNLLDNAVKYSPVGSTIHIHALKVDEEIQIRFRDRGMGIAKKHLPRLFERFYRVDKARSRKLGGTGLGLAIVKHIAQAHGGDITVESELEKGSTFTLHLPIKPQT